MIDQYDDYYSSGLDLLAIARGASDATGGAFGIEALYWMAAAGFLYMCWLMTAGRRMQAKMDKYNWQDEMDIR